MLLTSTLAINCYLRNFLNRAIGIINFAKHFQNFIDDTLTIISFNNYFVLFCLFIYLCLKKKQKVKKNMIRFYIPHSEI